MKRFIAIAAALAVVSVFAPSSATAQAAHEATETMVTSRAADGIQIDISIFKPATASAESPAPVVLHSHGWGGSKTASISSFTSWLDAGFGVVSITQRGFGNSGGEANVQDPELETEDIKAVIDHVATLDWVAKDLDENDEPIADDPVLGAIGGSYGGGYQTMTALDEVADEGRTRFNALSPEITWYDLNESLAPQGVVRTAWTAALFAVGATALPEYVHTAFAFGAATGLWPDGTVLGQSNENIPDLDSEFHEHGPIGLVEDGALLDIPVLARQGTSDNLFNLNQGLDIFHKALTEEAQADSFFVAFNGGHVLPNVAPRGAPLTGGTDACSGNWTQLQIDFFSRVFSGQETTGLLPARYNFTDLSSASCHRFESFGALETIDVNEDVDPTGSNGMVATAAAGAPIHLPLNTGAVTVTGVPKLSGSYYSGTVETRVFFALSVGTNPADAVVIQNNMMPLRSVLPSLGTDFEIELPGVSIAVPEGQSLFLTVSPISDMSFGHGSRAPGGFVLTDLELTLPTPGA